ncbi:sirohydrochlorin chelatase [Inhella gelatinilytica]|uniref:CbiX/SirB N-terminal domain-containing protein n=1 Tax=Inhella gelatinilytica TaxID=2795030 RepID=A0A931J1P8_9BURK|nr:CbiX/SirB N-terminal domain-containing protein [Inhella gelatinilytica]MBH9553741.1 CbiX/SirB N-terminal domain-containing protein [Inhella gelatinilytica]
MTVGLILLAHGARNPAWAAPFETVLARVQAKRTDTPVSLAYLELLEPSLVQAARDLVGRGATTLVVLPLFLGGAGHVRRDVEPQIQQLQTQLALPIRILPALGEQAFFQDALTAWCLSVLEQSPEAP